MTELSPTKKIVLLAFPVTLGMLSQNLMSLVDTYMVGVLGNSAVAALGLGGFIMFLCHAITLGMSTGVQARSARLLGRGDSASSPLFSAVQIMLLVAPIYSVLIFFLLPHLVELMNEDPLVVGQTIEYTQMRVWAIFFVGVNFAFRGYLAAIEMLRIYLLVILFMHLINICLNYLFIYGNWGFPAMGLEGAGLATLIATASASILYVFILAKRVGLTAESILRSSIGEARALIKVGMPYGVQQSLFAAGFTVLYAMIGLMGTVELAAATVVTNLTLFVFLPGIGLSIAGATLIGKAYGSGDIEQVKFWSWRVVRVGIFGFGTLGFLIFILSEFLLGLFLVDEATIATAQLPLQLAGCYLFIEAFYLVLTQGLYVIGKGVSAMRVTVAMQWLIFLPLVYVFGPVLGFGLWVVWVLQISYRSVQALLITLMWRRQLQQRDLGA